jgi:hypothetical protein
MSEQSDTPRTTALYRSVRPDRAMTDFKSAFHEMTRLATELERDLTAALQRAEQSDLALAEARREIENLRGVHACCWEAERYRILRSGINLPRYGNGIGNRLAAEALDAAIDAAISGNQPHTGD